MRERQQEKLSSASSHFFFKREREKLSRALSHIFPSLFQYLGFIGDFGLLGAGTIEHLEFVSHTDWHVGRDEGFASVSVEDKQRI